MENERRAVAEQILKTIEYGLLPVAEIERRLEQTISEALAGPIGAEYDNVKAELCCSLLQRIYSGENFAFEAHAEIIKSRITQRYLALKRRKKILIRGISAAAAVLVLSTVLNALNILSPIRWFTGESTEDEQQYIVRGHQIGSDIIRRVIAEHTESGVLSLSFTPNYTDVTDFLGFDPMLPRAINDEYKATEYTSLIMPNMITVACYYGENVLFHKKMFVNVSEAYMSYEQDREGEHIVIGGVSVYTYHNANRQGWLWFKDATIYSMTIPDTVADAQNLVERMMEILTGQ